jgi:hypothetical protein
MDESLSCIADLLRSADTDDRRFPPTLLFEEGWMLRLVLDWFQRKGSPGHALSFAPSAWWFSEARLASAFLPTSRGDKQSEGHTHADGVIGHFRISETSQAEFKLLPDARQFVVVEAKMFSGLSKGTTHARYYNQAARNVACMAHLLCYARLDPTSLTAMGFYVLAPKEQITCGVFDKPLDKTALEDVVRRRATEYHPPKTEWFDTWFRPMLHALDVRCLAWEDIVGFIKKTDPDFGDDLERFYERCRSYNRPAGRPVPA